MEISLKFLTYKTVFLTALALAGRCSDLVRLGGRPPYFTLSSHGIRLVPVKLKKQCREGHTMLDMFIPKFGENRKLDPVRALRVYLGRTESVRGESPSLFFTFGSGNKKVPSPRTVARWLVAVISATPGAVSGHVTAHSVRALSTSIAFQARVSLEEILKAADWSSSNTFCQFYLRDSQVSRASFSSAVLSSST